MTSRPLGITIIAIILAIGGVFQVIAGTEALRITSFGLGAATGATSVSGWASVISGVLTIVAAGGLFTLAGWAWMLVVAVLAIRIVVDLIAIVTHGASSTLGIAAITNVVVSGVILWYFQRSNVKASFGR